MKLLRTRDGLFVPADKNLKLLISVNSDEDLIYFNNENNFYLIYNREEELLKVIHGENLETETIVSNTDVVYGNCNKFIFKNLDNPKLIQNIFVVNNFLFVTELTQVDLVYHVYKFKDLNLTLGTITDSFKEMTYIGSFEEGTDGLALPLCNVLTKYIKMISEFTNTVDVFFSTLKEIENIPFLNSNFFPYNTNSDSPLGTPDF